MIRDRQAARRRSNRSGGSARALRIGAVLLALAALTPLILAKLPDPPPEQPAAVAIAIDDLT